MASAPLVPVIFLTFGRLPGTTTHRQRHSNRQQLEWEDKQRCMSESPPGSTPEIHLQIHWFGLPGLGVKNVHCRSIRPRTCFLLSGLTCSAISCGKETRTTLAEVSSGGGIHCAHMNSRSFTIGTFTSIHIKTTLSAGCSRSSTLLFFGPPSPRSSTLSTSSRGASNTHCTRTSTIESCSHTSIAQSISFLFGLMLSQSCILSVSWAFRNASCANWMY